VRLVKLTVNYDDPQTYHLYCGDKVGHPGTVLTFFPWPRSPRRRRGTGQATTVSFSIPKESMSFWIDRLKKYGIDTEEPTSRFKGEEQSFTFYNPDGLKLEMVAGSDASSKSRSGDAHWSKSRIDEDKEITEFHGVTLSEEGYERTALLLKETLGFRLIKEEGERFQYEVGKGGAGAFVDVLCQSALPHGEVLSGTVHHVAWRTPDDDQQKSWRQEIVKVGLNVTPIINRNYFHSIYFREPGGVLFEIATDPPGFTIDEPVEELGKSLKLPPWLEPSRKHIESSLPQLQVVGGARVPLQNETEVAIESTA